VEERVRRGPVIAGSIVLAVPYVLGLLAASGDDFSNQSGWLTVPVIGPWATLAAREKDCDFGVDYDECNDGVQTLLIMDGLMQATGAAFLIWGVAAPKKRLVRTDAWSFTPARIGRGYGFVSAARF
jgi:hypothetical protein